MSMHTIGASPHKITSTDANDNPQRLSKSRQKRLNIVSSATAQALRQADNDDTFKPSEGDIELESEDEDVVSGKQAPYADLKRKGCSAARLSSKSENFSENSRLSGKSENIINIGCHYRKRRPARSRRSPRCPVVRLDS